MNETHFLRKTAGRAAELFGITHWNNDLNLIRIYHQLSILLGNDEKLIRHWMQTPNKQLDNKVPANLVVSLDGELKILSTLDSYEH